MRVAIYVRVSTPQQAKNEVSLADQLAQLLAWANSEGHEIVDTFEERGHSAFKGNRPTYQHMMSLALSEEQPYDAIAFYDFSRFSRKTKVLLDDYERLDDHDVRIISISENLPNNEMTPVYLAMVGGLNESSSIRTSKHVTRCQRANAENGYFNGSRPPYGYKVRKVESATGGKPRSKLFVDPDENEVVQLIFTLATKGIHGYPLTLGQIVRELDKIGSTKRSRRWSSTMVSAILSDSVYIGERATFKFDSVRKRIRPREEWVITKVPQIISDTQFKQARKIIRSRLPERMHKKRAVRSSQLLSGIAVCGLCNAAYTVRTGTSGSSKKKQYAYYACSGKKNGRVSSCSSKYVNKEKLEEAIINLVVMRVLNPRRMLCSLSQLRSNFNDSVKGDKTSLLSLQRESAELESKIEALYDSISDGDRDAYFLRHMSKKKLRHKVVLRELESAKQKLSLPIKRVGIKHLTAFCKHMEKELKDKASPIRKQLILSTVSKVVILESSVRVSGEDPMIAVAASDWSPVNPQQVVRRDISNWWS
ncbi:MAG: recombinase family protein [Halioglobus sp.]